MDAAKLKDFIAVRPFQPFELRTVAGERYEVVTPEIMVDDTMTVILENGRFRFLANEAIESLRRLSG